MCMSAEATVFSEFVYHLCRVS